MSWTPQELDRFRDADELDITSSRADGTLRDWTPVWLTVVDGEVYVRTWFRRDTGWFGRAVRTGRARVRVPGVEAEITVLDVGTGPPGLREDVDAAYRSGYGRHGAATVDRMVTDAAAAATLRLDPWRDPLVPVRREAS